MFVEKIPIPFVNDDTLSKFEAYVDEILKLKNNSMDSSELEYKIDCMVCELYGLSSTESEYLGIKGQ